MTEPDYSTIFGVWTTGTEANTPGQPRHAPRYIGNPSNQFGYDPAGNMTLRWLKQGGSYTAYTQKFNVDNRLSQVSGNGTTTTYDLDAHTGTTLRRTQTSGGTTTVTDFVLRYYQKNVTAGTGTAYYYFGDRLVAQLSTTRTFLHGDHLGSTVLVTDGAGAVLARYRYHAYGRQREGSATTERRFTGQRVEASSYLYDYQARYYAPALGLFISPDPIVPEPGRPAALNRYSYGYNNPVKFVDPTGYFTEDAIKAYYNVDDVNDIWWWNNPDYADFKDMLLTAEADDTLIGAVGISQEYFTFAGEEKDRLAGIFLSDSSGNRLAGQPELIARSLNISIYLNLRLRRWAAAIACGEEALEYYVATGDQIMEADCLRAIGWARIFQGDLPAAIQALQTAYAISQQTENLWGQTDCAWKLAQALLETGAYGEAFRLAEHGVALARGLTNPHFIALNLMTLGTVQRAMLILDAARETQRQAIAAQATVPAPIFPDWAFAELCAIAALSGDWAAAHTYARQSLAVREAEHLLPIALTFWYEIEALLRGGDKAQARAEVERLDKLIGDNRRYRLPYLRSLAALAEWNRNGQQAITHLEEALSLAEEIGLPGEEWPILAKLGELYRTIGEEAQTQRALAQAAKITSVLGITPPILPN